MIQRGTPYPVGITGFMQREEAELAVQAADGYVTMIGVLASPKTLSGQQDSKPNRYPKREDIAGIFPEPSRTTLNLVHLGGVAERGALLHWMREAARYGGDHFEGLQLNAAFPDPEAIWQWKRERAGRPSYVVLQCGPGALDEVGRDPRQLAIRLVPYASVVDAVLIDDSGGEGRVLNPRFIEDCFAEIIRCDWDMGYGCAGGLNNWNADRLLRPIIRRHGNFSTDCESGVRDADDNLSPVLLVDHIGAIRETFDLNRH